MDKNNYTQMPLTKKDFLVVEESPNEALIYDSARNKLHVLTPIATSVWKICDGKSNISAITRKLNAELNHELSEDVTWLALEELEKSGLLETSLNIPQETISRRAMVKTAVAAVAISLPLVTTLIAPSPARAESRGGSDDMSEMDDMGGMGGGMGR